MFFYQRKFKNVEVRRYRFRDEWGKLHDLEIIKGELEPEELTDPELQAQLETTCLIRRYND